jgi:UDP-N-acetylglucosamine 2-epimerase (non-hydrolysing)
MLKRPGAGTNIFVFGTTGELIKIFPLITRLESEGLPLELWCTAQQVEELPAAIESLQIQTTTTWLTNGVKGHSLHTKVDVIKWLSMVSLALVKRRKEIRATTRRGAVFVHGDTMTTAIGAFFGRLFRGKVIHIEAGMRSGDWRNPFPEELSRRLVARLSDLNYAPGATAVSNLANARGRTVNTHVNTICDALKIAMNTDKGVAQSTFGLVSIHRSELYENQYEFTRFLECLTDHGKDHQLVFINHPVTAKRITDLNLDRLFDGTLISRIDKQQYFDFINLLGRAQYVVTDSGGLQQECEITGHPCLVHRAVTESVDIARKNIVLSRLSLDVLRDFLHDPLKFAVPFEPNTPNTTNIMFDDLNHHDILAR